MNIHYNYLDRYRNVIVSLKAHPWKLEEALNELDTAKHLLKSLKDRISEVNPE